MTETDATRRPIEMPERFIPYLEKYRIYKIFKDMIRDLVLNLPKDHLKHMKLFLSRQLHCFIDTDRVIILVSPELNIDIKAVAKEMIKDLGFYVITRRCVMDRYEKHDEYVQGCISPGLMSEVTKEMTLKDPVPQAGWLMFDHPCTVREARCLQQDGVLPTVTLELIPTPSPAPLTPNPLTPPRDFSQQDFEGLKYAYKATLKIMDRTPRVRVRLAPVNDETNRWNGDLCIYRLWQDNGTPREVYIDPEDNDDKIAVKCFNAVRACAAGAQGPRQGHHVVGAPGIYRVLIVGPRGAGRRSQALALAKHFGLVYLHFEDLLNEAKEQTDDIGETLRRHGPSLQLKADIVKRRLLKKDCIDHGWVLTGYPTSGNEFERLDTMTTPPNRVVFLNADWETCKARTAMHGVDWCTGMSAPAGSGPRVLPHPKDEETQLDFELDYYFSEALAEMRAAAGITAVEVNALEPFDKVQVKIQAAVISAPVFDIEFCCQLRNARGE